MSCESGGGVNILNWCPMAVFLVGETYWYHGNLSPCIDVSCGCDDVAAS